MSPVPNLPVPVNPLIGREALVAHVRQLIANPECRLITLTGPGGIGKTRLALELAWHVDAATCFVPLATVTDPDLVIPTIEQALGFDTPAGVRPALAEMLGHREFVLFLDNLEHLPAAFGVISDLLLRCPRLTVVATSRGKLTLAGEHLVPVEPLSLPAPDAAVSPERLRESEAVRLFEHRARAVHPSFVISASNVQAVTTICQRLDGLPLAIELAAARSNVLSAESLAARLEHRLQVLTGGPRDVPARLQTMRAAIAWSVDLLTERERAWWQRLGVFNGGFTAEAALALTPDPALPSEEALGILQSLIDHGLLRTERNASGEPRMGMLVTTRDYSRELLEQGGLLDEAKFAHARWFVAYAKSLEPGLKSKDPEIWYYRAESDIANFRDAMTWLRDAGEPAAALEIANSLSWFWTDPSYVREGRNWYEGLLQVPDADVPDEIRTRAMLSAGDLADWSGDSPAAIAWYEAALPVLRQGSDSALLAEALRGLGSVLLDTGAYAGAVTHLRESRELSLRAGDAWNAAGAANLLGIALREQGDLAGAIVHHEMALREWQEQGMTSHLPVALLALGTAQFLHGDSQRALESFEATLAIDPEGLTGTSGTAALGGFALIAAKHGQESLAARLLGAYARFDETIGLPRRPTWKAILDDATAKLRVSIGSGPFTALWSEGRTLTEEEALRDARAVTVPQVVVRDGLTRREREVLRLLVEGESDSAIAEQLFISTRTASKHVAVILEKLGATNRTAAATIAHRRGLV